MAGHGSTPYPKEMRDQAGRRVREWRKEYDRRDGRIREVAHQLGVHVESVRNWVRQATTDAGEAPGVTREDRARIRQLEKENAELRRANEILKSAAIFFGA